MSTVVFPPTPESSGGAPQWKWKRSLFGFGCSALILMTSTCAGCMVVGSRARSEGVAVVRDLAPRLMQPWAPEALSQNAAPALMNGMKPGQLEKLFRHLTSHLGPLKSIDQINEGPFNVFVSNAGFQVHVQYVMEATFEKGPATVRWTLLKQDGRWRIEGFFVNSDLMME
jgi:hypothetical protein